LIGDGVVDEGVFELELELELGATEFTEKSVPVVTVTSDELPVGPYAMMTPPESERATNSAAASSTGFRFE
jgi:hypothetical protein